MKKLIPYDKVPLLSFPDFDVISMNIQLEKKEIRIDIEGAAMNNNSVKLLGRGFLCFKSWKNLSIKEFISDKWTATEEQLRDICEFVCKKNTFVLRGFGKSTGHWIEYNITDAVIEAQFDEV